MQPVSTYV